MKSTTQASREWRDKTGYATYGDGGEGQLRFPPYQTVAEAQQLIVAGATMNLVVAFGIATLLPIVLRNRLFGYTVESKEE